MSKENNVSYAFPGAFPGRRLRRVRRHDFSRRLVAENVLTVDDLIYPVFVMEGKNHQEEVSSMPGVHRMTIDLLIKEAEAIAKLGVPVLSLFPVIGTDKKSRHAEEAYNPDGLVQRAVRALKDAVPELGLLTDVALDPYTTHGQDGVIDADGSVINDITKEIRVRQALSHAEAGAEIIAPSDMMDGRIGAIRDQLEAQQMVNTQIMAYSAKYASCYYGPFRDAAGSAPAFGDRKSYQMDFHNRREGMKEALMDIEEGADIIMVKPAMSYLDMVSEISKAVNVPVAAYSVSGEYALVKAAAKMGWIDEERIIGEMAVGAYRAGAQIYITYFAEEIAKMMEEGRIG